MVKKVLQRPQNCKDSMCQSFIHHYQYPTPTDFVSRRVRGAETPESQGRTCEQTAQEREMVLLGKEEYYMKRY